MSLSCLKVSAGLKVKIIFHDVNALKSATFKGSTTRDRSFKNFRKIRVMKTTKPLEKQNYITYQIWCSSSEKEENHDLLRMCSRFPMAVLNLWFKKLSIIESTLCWHWHSSLKYFITDVFLPSLPEVEPSLWAAASPALIYFYLDDFMAKIWC